MWSLVQADDKAVGQLLLILVFNLLVLILDKFVSSLSQMKASNFINPRKIAIQHLNIMLPSNRPKYGLYIFKLSCLKQYKLTD